MNDNEGIHYIDIIIPTFNNIAQLSQCVNSILTHTVSSNIMRIIVINNGALETNNYISKHPFLKMIDAGKNLGWEGGLKLGLEHSKAPFVMFMNDDTNIPYASNLWLLRMLQHFKDPKVAAVGPMSNVVAGYQNIFFDQSSGFHVPEAPFLIFFCVLLRRKYLDAIGGIDDTLPGGDDFDLSIRFKQVGLKLLIERETFVFHHGFQTGIRVRGSSDKPGGWNSVEMIDKTNHALIRKHGFEAFIKCHTGTQSIPDNLAVPDPDKEGAVVRKYITGESVLELGCGGIKTVPHSVGVDQVVKGTLAPVLEGKLSVADIVADVSGNLEEVKDTYDTIIARHILEHMIDPISCLETWAGKLKVGGRMIIAVPYEGRIATIPVDPTHKHAFVPNTLKKMAEVAGLKQITMDDSYNGISFTSVFERNGHEPAVL